MKERIKSNVEDIASRAHNGVDAAEEGIEDSIDGFSARLSSLERQLRDTGDRILGNAKSLSNQAGNQVRMHPLAAFGIAFVAGMTVARLMRR